MGKRRDTMSAAATAFGMLPSIRTGEYGILRAADLYDDFGSVNVGILCRDCGKAFMPSRREACGSDPICGRCLERRRGDAGYSWWWNLRDSVYEADEDWTAAAVTFCDPGRALLCGPASDERNRDVAVAISEAFRRRWPLDGFRDDEVVVPARLRGRRLGVLALTDDVSGWLAVTAYAPETKALIRAHRHLIEAAIVAM